METTSFFLISFIVASISLILLILSLIFNETNKTFKSKIKTFLFNPSKWILWVEFIIFIIAGIFAATTFPPF